LFRKIKSIEEIKTKTDTVVGEVLQVGDRTLYPVLRVSTLNNKGKSFFEVSITPLAMLIIEPTQEYAISLTDEIITLEKLLEMVPSLREKMKNEEVGGGS